MNAATRLFVPLAAALALLSACMSPLPSPDPAQARYRAAGNEPFWSVEVDDRMLVLRTPEDPDGEAMPAKRSSNGADIVFTQRAGAAPFVLRLHPGPCQDTMADKTWAYAASFSHGGQTLVGCAEAIE